MNTKKAPHNHVEAFCHMRYMSVNNPTKIINLRIWNSRDGVTPFCMFSKEFGIELQHVNWQDDRYDPDYKPKKGDLIWRNYTEEEARQFGADWYKKLCTDYERVKGLSTEELKRIGYDWDPRSMFKGLVEAGEQAAIDGHLEEIMGNGQPFLELVKEDWK